VKIYVAGPLAAVETVRRVQAAVAAAGHKLTLDWTSDASSPAAGYGSQLALSNAMAQAELDAVMDADAVVVVASEHDSVFYFHPAVQRVDPIDDWLAALR